MSFSASAIIFLIFGLFSRTKSSKSSSVRGIREAAGFPLWVMMTGLPFITSLRILFVLFFNSTVLTTLMDSSLSEAPRLQGGASRIAEAFQPRRKCNAGQECPAYRILKPLHSSPSTGRGILQHFRKLARESHSLMVSYPENEDQKTTSLQD